jgi:predicted Zn-dependent protease
MKRLAAALALAAAAAGAETYTYWIEECDPARSACRAGDGELARRALEDWGRASAGALRFERVAEADEARLRFRFAGPGNGVYGAARRILVNGRTVAEISIRPDVSAMGKRVAEAAAVDGLFREVVVYLTCLHEAGHALGLRHTAAFEDIMYNFQYGGDLVAYFERYRRALKSRPGIRELTGISPADAEALKRLYAQ